MSAFYKNYLGGLKNQEVKMKKKKKIIKNIKIKHKFFKKIKIPR